jgi:hypothetical protein
MLRTLRRRFGIAAPRVAVRMHVPWYVRWLGMLVTAIGVFALAWWTYDFGKQFAGFDQGEADRELARIGKVNLQLEQDNARMRGEKSAVERQMQIQRASYDDLVKQVKAVSEENAALKEDLAFFQTLMQPTGKPDGVSINRFRVTQDAIPGEYRYRMLLLQTGQRAKEFQGRLQFIVTVQQDGRRQMLTLPETQEAASYRVNFKFYQRTEGTFKVAPNAAVKSVQIRVFEDGAAQPRLVQTVTLS